MKQILLVEDDSALVEGLVYSLQKAGFAVENRTGIQAGWAAFLQNTPDLIILDVGLPDGTGYTLCEQVRKQSSIPILFLTACDEETQVVMGLDMGGDDYITKPFRLQELLSRIRALLRRAEKKAPQQKASGLFLLDFEQSRLYKEGQEIALTPAEYRLFVLLFQHEGQIITRQQLLSTLWDNAGEFVDDNTLTVYIRRLREKLERDPSHPTFLQTVRGTGYRFMVEGGKNQ